MQRLLESVIDGKTLSRVEAEEAMDFIVSGDCYEHTIGEFLLALREREETPQELAGFAASMRKHAIAVPVTRRNLLDTCGTGGDGAHTFNISTAAALIAASAGIGVAKHGNRSVSSPCGSADVYEALGLKISSDPGAVAQQIDCYGFGFLFAPYFHPAMQSVARIRRLLGVRTVFNLLGPLTNPAPVKRQVIGVYDRALIPRVVCVLKELGTEEALVFASHDHLDEIALSADTDAVHLHHGVTSPLVISPEDFGLRKQALDSVRGGDALTSAQVILDIFDGKLGPHRDILVINAGAALWIGGVTNSLSAGVREAATLLTQGEPRRYLDRLRAVQ